MLTLAEYNEFKKERFRLKKDLAMMIRTKCVKKVHDIKKRLDSINRQMEEYRQEHGLDD